ncbi:MAG: trypsin-like peptidase domain-containing protein [Victivallales bacterium]|nr:trypsin-like peptidase domain-containing protein [Victivallales bacterium]
MSMIFWEFPEVLGQDAAPALPPPSAARLTPEVLAVKKALPWVVNIGTNEQIIQVNDPFAPFFMEFFNRRRDFRTTTQYSPIGSGVIVDPHGLILTNEHVVRRAPQIEVRLWDGTAYPAQIVGFDTLNDLCLLQLAGDYDGHPLAYADFAHANDLMLGESVIAIGNPFGLEHSVSRGVISAFDRSFMEGDVAFDDIIQIDAAINPGNSGGPLINLDGQLIGINLAIRADAQGIGFAIPLARIERFLSYWLTPAHFSDHYLGLEEPVASFTAEGIVLPEIRPGSPLAKAGFAGGEVIAAVNGKPVGRPIDFGRELWTLMPEEEVTLAKADGTKVAVRTAPMPDELLVETRLGLHLQELTPAVRKSMRLAEDIEGVMVSQVVSDPAFSNQSAQWHEVIKRGDIIAQINHQEVKNAADIARALRDSRSGSLLQLGFYSFLPNRRQFAPLETNARLN